MRLSISERMARSMKLALRDVGGVPAKPKGTVRASKPKLPVTRINQAGLFFSFTILGAPRTKKNSLRRIRRGTRTLSIPSEAYEEWFVAAMRQAVGARQSARICGIELPIPEHVEVRAIFYRAQLSGDLVGYEQALGDWMQDRIGKQSAAGLIVDDVQIESWDGSRLRKDADNPRIDVTVTIL